MSYKILRSDGTTELTTIADGTADTAATGLTLAGPNYVGYGLSLNENLVKLLENFASNVAPMTTNVQGQLWFNKFTQTLNVFTGQEYAPVSGVTVSGTRPYIAKEGDIWYNNNTNQQFLYSNNQFNLIGPIYTKQQGASGVLPITVNDGSSSGITHDILQVQFGNTVIATFSTDLRFIPSPAMTGFPYINQGITLNNTLTNASLNSNLVGSVLGPVTGDVVGNITATTLTGTLTGNVFGNVTSTRILTSSLSTITSSTNYSTTNTAWVGNLSTANAQITGGNISSTDATFTTGVVTNFSTGNAQITAGNITNLGNLSATTYTGSNASITTAVVTNFSTGNAQIVGGSITGLANITATYDRATNFSTGNAQITGGNVTGLGSLSTTAGTFNSITTSTIAITGGNLTVTNFATGNAVITGGYATGLANVISTIASHNITTTYNIKFN